MTDKQERNTSVSSFSPQHRIEDFRYVLPEKTQDPIAFLSKKERETLPTRGTTRFDKEHSQQRYPNVAPNLYEKPSAFSMTQKKPSGLGGLGGNTKRFNWRPSMAPSPATYNLRSFPAEVKPNKAAFNSSSSRKSFKEPPQGPSVGTYSPLSAEADWRIPFSECFGSKKTMIPAVEVKCSPFNVDKCSVCGETPKGDYYQRDVEFLCRPCMANMSPDERRKAKDFKKVRDCTFMHMHEGTSAKINLMAPKDLIKFQRKEAYLAKYFKD